MDHNQSFYDLPNRRSKVLEKYEGLDKFGKSFRFNFEGKRYFQTSFGASITILM